MTGVQTCALPISLKDAIGKGVLVRIRYVSRDGEETVRLVRPDALEEKATGWYLDAYCTMREDQRTFFVPRIREAVLTDEPAPKDDERIQGKEYSGFILNTEITGFTGPNMYNKGHLYLFGDKLR